MEILFLSLGVVGALEMAYRAGRWMFQAAKASRTREARRMDEAIQSLADVRLKLSIAEIRAATRSNF